LNVVGRAGVIIPDLGADRLRDAVPPQTTALPGQGDAGAWITAQTFGAYAGFDLENDVALPNVGIDLTLYAPTMVNRDPFNPGRFGCIETVTAHYIYPSQGMTQTAHAQGFWDHCVTRGWGLFKFTNDPAWQSTYVRFQEGENRFYTMLWYDTATGVTHGMLWNYNLSVWEDQYHVASPNTQPSTGGWTMFETIFNGVCPVLPSIRASGTQVLRSDGTWSSLAAADGFQMGPPTGGCFPGAYTFRFNAPLYDWEVDPT
jgi:hypothetical protein